MMKYFLPQSHKGHEEFLLEKYSLWLGIFVVKTSSLHRTHKIYSLTAVIPASVVWKCTDRNNAYVVRS